VASCCRGFETYLSFVLRVETCCGKETDDAYDVEEILSGQLTENAAFDVVVVEIERILTMVSDVYDEVVEMQNDCPKVSDDAHEIYRDGLHVHDHDLLQVCKHRARDLVGRVSVSCHMSAILCFFCMGAKHLRW
jgi:hypothetical protein